jgi:hypothetical protein
VREFSNEEPVVAASKYVVGEGSALSKEVNDFSLEQDSEGNGPMSCW